jgi:hypothetical protein
MASFDSRFGHPDYNLHQRLESMVETGSNPGLRAFMMKMGWQPPSAEIDAKDYLHDTSIRVSLSTVSGPPSGYWYPMTQFHDLRSEYMEEYLNFGSESEMAAVADFVNTWCADDTPGFPLWMQDIMQLMKTKPLIRETLKILSNLYDAETNNNGLIAVEGRALYMRIVGSVQKRFQAQPADTSIELLIVVVLLGMFEVRSASCHSSPTKSINKMT